MKLLAFNKLNCPLYWKIKDSILFDFASGVVFIL